MEVERTRLREVVQTDELSNPPFPEDFLDRQTEIAAMSPWDYARDLGAEIPKRPRRGPVADVVLVVVLAAARRRLLDYDSKAD